MPPIVNSINHDSIAEDLEISVGDRIISINGIEPQDLIDYKYLVSSENISVHIKRASGEEEIFDIEKDIDEDLGINFESAVFDKVIPCNNKCVFCFVDQQPKGLRDSLYVKDDDYRLSFLQGTYITLTNLAPKHKTRIETLRPGPLYISVHTTNPELRARMLNNPKAKGIIKELKWLESLEIPIHVQIVLCPGFNDREELNKTLKDLGTLSNILSIAVVPLGVTKYRNDKNLVKVDKLKAQEIIAQIHAFNKNIGYNLAFPADEFYILAGYDFPETYFYNDFGQLDDGVGSCRLLIDDFQKNRIKLPQSLSKPCNLTIATGEISYNTLNVIVSELNKIKNLSVDLVPIKSRFWGEDITVSGLITGKDLLDNLLPKKNITDLVLPSVMLRKCSDEFIDSMNLTDIHDGLKANIHVIENCYSSEELIDLILSFN